MIAAAMRSLPAHRIVSAACALVITSVIVLAVGLGFSSQARAQTPERSASAPLKTGFVGGGLVGERSRHLVGLG